MQINTKFDLDQFVYAVHRARMHGWEICKTCSGKGKVFLNGDSFSCPKCYGRKGEEVNWHEGYAVGSIGVIGKVDTQIYSPEYDREDEIRYMLDTTGVGSGTCWPEKDLFASKEEAEAECARRNQEMENHETD